jgi:hypothetical protein
MTSNSPQNLMGKNSRELRARNTLATDTKRKPIVADRSHQRSKPPPSEISSAWPNADRLPVSERSLGKAWALATRLQHPISPASQLFDRKPPDSGLQPPDERGGNACGTKQNQQSFGRALPTLQLTA